MKHKNNGCMAVLMFIVVFFTMLLSRGCRYENAAAKELGEEQRSKLESFIDENNLKLSDYKPELLRLMKDNPEAEDFVLRYPLDKDKDFKIDFSEYKNADAPPLFLQWDKRWGYKRYGSSVMGVTGCGPTCLSMVSVYLLGDLSMDPWWMADFSMKNGYYRRGSGTSWSLMSEGAEKLGLKAEELPLDKNKIIGHLEKGNPIICIMGAGDFTDSGHYIVLIGLENEMLRINDPNSIENTSKLWNFDKIKGQIRNLWVYEK